MTRLTRLTFVLLGLTIATPAANACEDVRSFERDRVSDFYSEEKHGLFGIPSGRDRIMTMDAAGCYDASMFARTSILRFHYSNVVEDKGDGDPNILGVLVIKTYDYRMRGEPSVGVSFFRNENDPGVGEPVWATYSREILVDRNARIARSEAEIVAGYDPSATVTLGNLSELEEVAVDAAADPADPWNALIVGEANDRYIVFENSRHFAARFGFSMAGLVIPEGGTVQAKLYLVKYADTARPNVRQDYLKLNPIGANCIFIKYFSSGSSGPMLAPDAQGNDFITLVMKPGVTCMQ